MNPYPSYKESGVEWVGEIPKEWNVQLLKYVCEYNQESLGNNTEPDYELDYIEISDVDPLGNIGEPTHHQFSKSLLQSQLLIELLVQQLFEVREHLQHAYPLFHLLLH